MVNRSYGLKPLTAKLFVADLRDGDGARCDFELAYSRNEAFRNCARRNSGCKIISFRDEFEMSPDELEQARDWRSAGAKHEVDVFAGYRGI